MEIVHCRHDNSAAENLSFSQWYTLVIRRFYRLKSTAARETFLHKHDSCHVVVLDFDPIFVGTFWCWEITKTDSKNSNFAWHIFEHLHSVWKLLKMSHLIFFNFGIFYQFLTCLVTLFDRKLQVFKNSTNWPFLAFLMNFCPLKM